MATLSPQLSQRSSSSVGSHKSAGSKYKTVGRSSAVDESLFGGQRRTATGDVAKKEEIQRLLSKKPTQVETDSVVITQYELDRLKVALSYQIFLHLQVQATSNVLEEQKLRKKQLEEDRARAQAAAKERKHRMLEKEAERKKNEPKSDLQLESQQYDNALLANAQMKREEQLDEVKAMNQMMLYAKCVTIRDMQLLEKQAVAKEQAEIDRKLDIVMEENRMRAIRLQEETEKIREEERRKGAEIIRVQILEREREKLRQQELLDIEREAMLKQMEALKVEEKKKEEQRRVQGLRLLEEAAQANAEMISKKEEVKIKALEEEARIAAYIKERETKELARQAELERVAREKAEEVARLRALQEKAADKQAELDAIRARRAQEDYERDWRRKERVRH